MSQRERQRRYAQTDKGKATRKRAHARWLASGGQEVVNASKRKRWQAQREMVARIKVERGCVDCGYNAHPAALDFDHRDPSLKRYAIAKKYGQVSNETLLVEIEKCDVRCANCHRVRSRA